MAKKSLAAPVVHGAGVATAIEALAADVAVRPDARTWSLLFGALSAAEQQALAEVARARPVAAGAEVFSRHDEASALVALLALLRGDVALGFRGADGAFHVERPVRGTARLVHRHRDIET